MREKNTRTFTHDVEAKWLETDQLYEKSPCLVEFADPFLLATCNESKLVGLRANVN